MTDISIICTVKNGERTIKNTIQSVINQSLTDWEFIIVDDGSDDNTIEILKEYSSKDERIKIIETGGIGRGKALNLAVSNAKGNFIANIDSDDLMHPQKLECQYPVLKKNPKYFLISTDFIIIYDDSEISWELISKKEENIEMVNNKNLMKNQVNHSSVMMRKDILESIGGYDENRRSQFDYELWLRAGYAGYSIGVIRPKLVAKRIHSNQSYEKKRVGQLNRSIILQLNYIIKSRKLHLIIFPLGRFLLGLLPFKIRQVINKLIKL